MTFREQIADWISGGALTRLRFIEGGWQQRASWAMIETARAESALARIAAMETPGANATVRRMAQEARDALT
jgi:hypothetical protein